MALGITGPFETHKPGILYAYMTGDIEKAAGLTVPRRTMREILDGIYFRPRRPFDAQAVGASARGSMRPVVGRGGPRLLSRAFFRVDISQRIPSAPDRSRRAHSAPDRIGSGRQDHQSGSATGAYDQCTRRDRPAV
jgi:hypothetical protein